MGNILSFPILCLVNLAGWLLSYVRHEKMSEGVVGDKEYNSVLSLLKVALDRGYLTWEELDILPVLINGDDILFQADPGHYQTWCSVIGELGFKKSVGKNYYTNRFFTVNSELYVQGEGGIPQRVYRPFWSAFQPDFLSMRQEIRWNTGVDLMTADSRLVLPSLQEDLLYSVSDTRAPLANRLWFQAMKGAGLLDPYRGLNWFLPIELGGMGLASIGLEEGTVNYAQRKLAVRLALDPTGKGLKLVKGSLLTEHDRRVVRSQCTVRLVEGEPDARGYVPCDTHPIQVSLSGNEDGESVRLDLSYFSYRSVEDYVQTTRLVPSWLDYHTDGVKVDSDHISKEVSRYLSWGCGISDRTVHRLYDHIRYRRYVSCLAGSRVCTG